MRTVWQGFITDLACSSAQYLRSGWRGGAAVQAERAQQQYRNAGLAQAPPLPPLLLPLKTGQGGTGLPQLLQMLVLRNMARIGLAPLVERVLVAGAIVSIQPPACGFARDRVLAHAPGTCCRATRARSRWPCAVCRLMPS